MVAVSTQYASKGAIYIRNAGQDVALQPGTSGQVLVTKGAEAYPEFRDIVLPLLVFLGEGNTSIPALAQTDVPVDYTDFAIALKFPIPFDVTPYRKARLWVRAQGNEAGNAKGIAVYSGATLIAKVEWNGNAENVGYGAWNDVSAIVTASTCNLKSKGSAATEDLTISSIILELML